MREGETVTEAVLVDALQRQLGAELIETHISWVLLAEEYVYKVKKPLNLGFLDFSTLERRRYFCEEELRLNSRLAPDLYLDVVAIGDDGQIGAPRASEYAVRMRRFPQQAQLDRMLRRGELNAAHIDAFARMCADFHSRVAVAGEESEYGEPLQVWRPVEENFSQIREHLAPQTGGEALAMIEQWSRQQYRQLEPLLGKRKAEGFIRECHGDMHLRNLAWVDERPVAFDCIEFNPALRWIDVISEVAFMVMDLQARDEPLLAQRFLNRYLEVTGDYSSLALLPFYLVYRALVRAKVAAISSDQHAGEKERAAALEEYNHYLELAEGYTRGQWPVLVITRGMSASGKSTWTESLLEKMGAIRLRSDVERKRLFGMAAEESGRSAPGEGIYTQEAGKRTYERLVELAHEVLQSGFPVIVDAVCARREQRLPFELLARELNLPWLIVEFHAEAAVLRQRIVQRGAGVSDADLNVLERQLTEWQPLESDEAGHCIEVDSNGLFDSEALLYQVKEALKI